MRNTILWGMVIILIVLNVGHAVSIVFSHSPDIRGDETYDMHTVQNIMVDNLNLYPNPETFPYAITPKSPFYYILCDAVLTLFNVRPGEDVDLIYVLCRGLSFLCTLLILGILFHISRRILSLSILQTILALNLSVLVTFPWLYLARPDACVSLFYFVTIWCVLEYWNRNAAGAQRAEYFLLFAGISSSFAFFSKQNGVMIFGTVLLFLLWKRYFKGIALLTAGFAIGGLLGGSLYFPYASPYLWKNVFDGVKNGISVNWAFKQCYYDMLTLYSVLTISGIAAEVYLLWKQFSSQGQRKNDNAIQFLLLCYGAFFCMAIVTGLKVGSAINYFNEAQMLSLLLVLIAGRDYRSEKKGRWSAKYLTTMIFVVLFIFGVFVSIRHYAEYSWDNLQEIRRGRMISRSEQQLRDFLQEKIALEPAFFVFSEMQHHSILFPAHVVFPELGISRQSGHALDYSGVRDDVREGRIQYYITTQPIEDVFYLTKQALNWLRDDGVKENIIQKIKPLKWMRFEKDVLVRKLEEQLGEDAKVYEQQILEAALLYRLFNVELERYFSLYREFGQIKVYRYHE